MEASLASINPIFTSYYIILKAIIFWSFDQLINSTLNY